VRSDTRELEIARAAVTVLAAVLAAGERPPPAAPAETV
jgi:hypothetical protein